jgi:hypothetical protein
MEDSLESLLDGMSTLKLDDMSTLKPDGMSALKLDDMSILKPDGMSALNLNEAMHGPAAVKQYPEPENFEELCKLARSLPSWTNLFAQDWFKQSWLELLKAGALWDPANEPPARAIPVGGKPIKKPTKLDHIPARFPPLAPRMPLKRQREEEDEPKEDEGRAKRPHNAPVTIPAWAAKAGLGAKKSAAKIQKPAIEHQKHDDELKNSAVENEKPDNNSEDPAIEVEELVVEIEEPAGEIKKPADEIEEPVVEIEEPAAEIKKPVIDIKKSAAKRPNKARRWFQPRPRCVDVLAVATLAVVAWYTTTRSMTDSFSPLDAASWQCLI